MDGEVKVKIKLDGASEYSAGLEQAQRAHAGLSESAKQAGASVGGMGAAARKASDETVKGSKQAAQAIRMLPAQLGDVVTSLQGGMSPFTVLLQQGLQTRDMFGGFRPMLSGLLSLVTPVAVGITAVATASAALAYGFIEGQNESERFRDKLAMTGNAAGTTEGQFNSLAERVKDSTGVTVGSAREMAEGLVATGRFGSASLESVASAAVRVAEVSGATAEDVIKDFATMSGNVASWAAKHNESWNFATADQIDYIRQLDETGRSQQAMIEVGNMLTNHLAQQRENLGLLESAWRGVKGAASSAWDAMLGIGRSTTVNDRIKEVQDRLEKWRNANPAYSSAPAAQKEIAELQSQLQLLNRDALRQADVATNKAYSGQQERDAIARREELRNVTTRLSAANQQYIKDLKTIQASAAAGEITEARRLELLTAAAVKYGEQPKRPTKGKTAKQVAEERERDYLRMVRETLANRAPRLANIEGEQSTAASASAEANMAAQVATMARRNEEAKQLGREYADQTAQINAGVIADDRQRGLAQIELERKAAQERLDAMAAYGTDVRQAQTELNAYILARQGELNEQLKPQWQRNLEAWQDKNRLMRETWSSTMDHMIQGGEDAWVRFATTGELSVKSLVDTVMADLARMQFREVIAPGFAKASNAVLGFLGVKNTAGATGGEQGKALEKGAEGLQDTAKAFGNPIEGLVGAGQSLMQSALGWLLPQATQTTAAVTMGTAAGALMSAAAALTAAAGTISAAGAGNAGGDLMSAALEAFGFADGGAFGQGEVLTQPTLFRFRQAGAVRLGMAGEAGPEAALPLKGGGVTASAYGRAIGSIPLTRRGGVLGVDLSSFVDQMQAKTGPGVAMFAAGGVFSAGFESGPTGVGSTGTRAGGGEKSVLVQQTLVFHGDGVNRSEMVKFGKRIQDQTEAAVFDKMRRGKRN